jgi:branched-chain amino acid transport system substrate-binding protein
MVGSGRLSANSFTFVESTLKKNHFLRALSAAILATSTLLGSVSLFAQSADIVIGQSAPLSGSNADFGKDIRAGALAYFKQINDEGGINGRQLKLVTLDDRNDAKVAGENAKKLIEDERAVALFGFASATLSLPAMPIVAEKRVPFFAPFTGADTIRKQNDYVYTIRVSYTEEIEKLVNFWGSLGTTRIAVLHYDDQVGKQNFESVAAALRKFGKTPTSVAIKRNAELSDDTVNQVIAADPQMVLVTTLSAPAAKLISALQVKNKPFPVTSLSFVGVSQLTKLLGTQSAGITVALTVPAPRNTNIAVVKECSEAWKAAGNPAPMSVTSLEACIAAKVLVEGIKRAGKTPTRDSLQTALSALTRVDVGGFEVAFKPAYRHGGKFVDIAVIRTNGELRS